MTKMKTMVTVMLVLSMFILNNNKTFKWNWPIG